jgi:Xaa-Pro aminopeptidase
MFQGDIDATRELAARADLDALLVFAPRNVAHLTGFAPANSTVTGVFWSLLPTDPSLPSLLTVGEFDLVWARQRAKVDEVRFTRLWIEIVDRSDLDQGTLTEIPKPVQFSPDAVVDELRSALGSRQLLSSRIGIDIRQLPWTLHRTLTEALPTVDWVAADALLAESTLTKTQDEVAALRKATHLTELGIRKVFLEHDPRGRSVSQLRNDFELAVRAAVGADVECEGYGGSRVYISTGPDIGPNLERHGRRVESGDVVWIDAGCVVDGYVSDIGRTFTVDAPHPTVRRIADALEAGSDAGFELMGPGVSMSSVFQATQAAVRANGLPTYTRGHFGHAVGIGIGERGPYFSEESTQDLVPGMVLAFERPYYARGLGGFQFEENFVVTEGGVDYFTSLPRTLIEI